MVSTTSKTSFDLIPGRLKVEPDILFYYRLTYTLTQHLTVTRSCVGRCRSGSASVHPLSYKPVECYVGTSTRDAHRRRPDKNRRRGAALPPRSVLPGGCGGPSTWRRLAPQKPRQPHGRACRILQPPRAVGLHRLLKHQHKAALKGTALGVARRR